MSLSSKSAVINKRDIENMQISFEIDGIEKCWLKHMSGRCYIKPFPFLHLKQNHPTLKGNPVNQYFKQHWSGNTDSKQIRMNSAHRWYHFPTSHANGQNLTANRTKVNPKVAILLERLLCILATDSNIMLKWIQVKWLTKSLSHNINSALIHYWPSPKTFFSRTWPPKTFISKDYPS